MKRSPLVIFHKQLGDVLLLEPALAKLAAATGQPVTYATRPVFSPMLALMENVLPLAESIFRTASTVISFEHRSRACLLALTTMSPDKRLIVSAQRHLRAWHRPFFDDRRVVEFSDLYRAEHYFRAMPAAGDMGFRPPRLRSPPQEWKPTGLPTGYVLLHATSAWKRKSWTPEAWAQTLNVLHERGIGPFVVTGGNADWEKEYVQAIRSGCKAPIIDLSGKTELAAYLAVIANARALLCIDGSSSHIAAALGVPAVTLFGPSHPVHWNLPSDISVAIDARKFCPEPAPATSHIPPSAVLDAFLPLLERGS